MPLANIITLIRIAMIPCFVMAVIYYAGSVKKGAPVEWQRWAAVSLFVAAALADALDGYIARWLDQKSRLGSILDPIADKALLLTALVLLSWNQGDAFPQLPLWFPILVVSRDVVVVLGVAVVFMMGRGFNIDPHWSGKLGTVLQMVTLGLVLLNVPDPWWQWPLETAGFFTVLSGGIYVVQGARKLSDVPPHG